MSQNNNTPGVCVERGDGSFSWSPVKISRSAVKVGDVDSSECSDVDIDECLSLSYHPREGVPGLRLRLRKMHSGLPLHIGRASVSS